jgi:hypothetical protein
MAGFANDVVYANNADFSIAGSNKGQLANGILTDGQLWIGRTAVNAGGTHIDVNTLTAGTGMTITNGPGTITLATTASLTDLHVARFIVASSTLGTGANFTSITAAIASAVGTGINSTIFLQPGTYTENFTLPAGINLCAFDCDPFTPNVTIVGTITMTAAGTSSISGIRLQTNSAALLAVTGTLATIINLNNCYLNCTNATGITFSTNSGSAQINITDCKGDLGTTGIKLFTHTSAGTILFLNSNFSNSGGTTTATTQTTGGFNTVNSRFQFPFSLTSTSATTWEYSLFSTSPQNVTSATLNGSTHSCKWCRFDSGSASSVSIGSSAATMELCTVSSSNTNSLTGPGTLNYSFISFDGSSSGVNVSTLVPLATLI